MKADKRNGDVNFNEDEHLYWNDNGDKYISVTTLIDKYTQPFDSDFWSKYKALERLLGKEMFAMEKQRLLKTKKWDDKILDSYDIDILKFKTTQQDILDEWEAKNREACERGTEIHSQMEKKFYTGKDSYSLKSYGLGGQFQYYKEPTFTESKMVCPEYLIAVNKPIFLAGQIDLLIKDGNDITIADYKTNGSIDLKSGFNTTNKKYYMMQYPLNNLMDCNFFHYTMQLSTYAWMVQQNHPDLNIKKLMLIHFPHEGGNKVYDVEYRKDDVEKMIKEYQHKLEWERRNNARKRIEF